MIGLLPIFGQPNVGIAKYQDLPNIGNFMSHRQENSVTNQVVANIWHNAKHWHAYFWHQTNHARKIHITKNHLTTIDEVKNVDSELNCRNRNLVWNLNATAETEHNGSREALDMLSVFCGRGSPDLPACGLRRGSSGGPV